MPESMVSVIVPVYNGARYLKESVETALAQTHENLQIIIINDGSTDGSGEIAEELRRTDDRVIVVHQENRGLSAARNTGLDYVEGEFVNFLDADDWLFENKIEVQLAALTEAPDYGLAYSDYVKRHESEEFQVARGIPPLPFPRLLVYRNWFAPMVPLVRTSLIKEVGQFDTSMRASEDWDYWFRCAQHTEFLYVPGILAAYRLHDSQMTKDRSRMVEGQQKFASKHLRSDPSQLRAFRTYHHMSNARHAKATGQFWRCLSELSKFMLNAQSYQEARFVWRMPP